MQAQLEIDAGLCPNPTRVGLFWATDLQANGTTAAGDFLGEAVQLFLKTGEGLWSTGLRERVRGMLRHGSYRPAGRAKPSSEFLARAAERGQMPQVSGPVDATNTVSLLSGFTPSVGDQFVIVTAGTLSGTFTTTNLPPGLNWDVAYDNFAGTVTIEVLP